MVFRRIGLPRVLASAAAVALIGSQPGWAQPQPQPQPGPSFAGVIGKTYEQSRSILPTDPTARVGAPNVLVWMLDDVGFAQLGAFGGLIETPNIDRVARTGLRYTNYHTTPICSASRAAFLTGRNSHSVHHGGHANAAMGFPGYDARIPPEAGTVADYLRSAGYRTLALGKWDHLPTEHASQAGPFAYWPSGQGFDHFYGFLAADVDQFKPVLWADQTPLETPGGPDYSLTGDLADQALRWINARDAATPCPPFFIYWATGAVHAPHQAPEAHLKRYRGRFDKGWDVARTEILARQKSLGIVPQDAVLPPRPGGMPAWDSLTPEARRLYARAMEAFAAYLTYADAEFGRILNELEKRGELDNTIVVITSDNGAEAGGGPDGTYNETLFFNGQFPSLSQNLAHLEGWGGPSTAPLYPLGWAVAGNTPFRYYKQTAYEGGVRTPFIIAWPNGIKDRGALRTQFHHVSDVAPTLLDAAQVKQPATVGGVRQAPFEGTSMAYSFAAPKAPTAKHVQYFDMYGNRAIWSDGWKAVVPHKLEIWRLQYQPAIKDDEWELYDLTRDPNERVNLARREPQRLKSMVDLFDREARKYNVYPLTNIGAAGQTRVAQAAQVLQSRKGVWTYKTPITRVPERLMPPMLERDFVMTAHIEVPADGADGVLMATGGRFGGMAVYLLDGKPVFAFRKADLSLTRIVGPQRLAPGETTLAVDFRRRAGGAHVRLLANDRELASGDVPGPLPYTFSITETFDLGSDTGDTPVGDYQAPFAFTGKLNEVAFDFTPPTNQLAGTQ